MVQLEWRGEFDDGELNALHAEAFGYPVESYGWRAQVAAHSLGWVTARDRAGGELVGFVNVPWDGGLHAFIMDTVVRKKAARRGLGTQLVGVAAQEARAAGCGYLHVDFEEHLAPFYFDACGFRPTPAGVMKL